MQSPVAGRGLRVGPYFLERRLAAGGMGEVFVATTRKDTRFEKRVALKLLLPHLSQDPKLVQMFMNEVAIATQMNHPNVLQVFDAGEAGGRYYLAMALVEGASLSALIKACREAGRLLPLPVVNLIAN